MPQDGVQGVVSSAAGALLARPRIAMLLVMLVLFVAVQGGAAALDLGGGECAEFCFSTDDESTSNTGP